MHLTYSYRHQGPQRYSCKREPDIGFWVSWIWQYSYLSNCFFISSTNCWVVLVREISETIGGEVPRGVVIGFTLILPDKRNRQSVIFPNQLKTR